MSKRFAVIVGARPNFVKAAPFFHEARKHPEYVFTLIHTGQHFDAAMSSIFFDEMDIPRPDIVLKTRGEFHTEKIGTMFSDLNTFFHEHAFDGVIVFGDVNSTLAGALAASKNHQFLIHIEAGLRSHDRRMPEEINRVIVDHLADLLCTTEPEATENLKREGIAETSIKQVGNIMIEAIELFRDKIENSSVLATHQISSKSYVLATLHRQENTDDPIMLERLLDILIGVGAAVPVVMPLHPGTRKKIQSFGLEEKLASLHITEPLGYFDFLKLMMESSGVITDSGGIQEETSHLGIPCVTLRDSTERPITLSAGSNKLFPPGASIKQMVPDMLAHLRRTDFKAGTIPLWDAHVAHRIFIELNTLTCSSR